MTRNKAIWIIALFLSFAPLRAQETEILDSLEAARISTTRRLRSEVGTMITTSENIRSAVMSPLGEGDALRWVQTLPGVATGADGTSAYYVRGGNSGGNLLTIDGVPVFGYSHLLGLTMLLPTEATESVSFSKGGFLGGQGNFSSSHLDVRTVLPTSGSRKVYLSLNNFLAGAGATVSLGNKVSLVFAGRISPLALEYKALKGLKWEVLGDLEEFDASVFDLYGKILYRINGRHQISLSGMRSKDYYTVGTSDASVEKMGWGNTVGTLQSHHEIGTAEVNLSASYNVYQSVQEQNNIYRGKENYFYLSSSLKEAVLSGEFFVPFWKWFRVGTGITARFSSFAPTRKKEEENQQDTRLISGFLQGSFKTKSIQLEGSIRLNRHINNVLQFDSPDYNLSAKWQVIPLLALEGTYDQMSQFYHTLEGLPLGWSMDVILPSSVEFPVEKMTQGYLGLVFTFGKSTLSAGAFTREMENLVYFKNASDFFSGTQTEWEETVDIGNGDARGIELLYEYSGKNLYAKASATLFKANRKEFKEVNDGKPFHAPFDRGLVANLVAEWKKINVSFVYQGGNWVNGRGELYTMHLMNENDVLLKYYTGINNHQMSPVIRLDVGYHFHWKGKWLSHDLNVGVCNLLNHFNPYTIYYDTKEEEWKEIALLPILPNFSYRISF